MRLLIAICLAVGSATAGCAHSAENQALFDAQRKELTETQAEAKRLAEELQGIRKQLEDEVERGERMNERNDELLAFIDYLLAELADLKAINERTMRYVRAAYDVLRKKLRGY